MARRLKPIVFVAFADPNDVPGAALDLRKEEENIEAALADVRALGSWELASGLNCTRAEIVETFNSDRVAVFHFGGHASPQSLLLPAETKGNQIVSGVLLEDFLARQKNLKLAFFNACSTQQWAAKLAERIPYVVATVCPVEDGMALHLAKAFYGYLASDCRIEDAFARASAAVVLQHEELKPTAKAVETDAVLGRAEFRRMDEEDDEPAVQVFPWILCRNPHLTDEDRGWSFSVGAHDPLIGLPLLNPAEYTLPERPYVTIKGHTEQHAPLFFGMNAEIRTLYDWALGERAPVMLFYGQSGAGKSSLLNAGLLPRLRKRRTVEYRRRNEDLTEDLKSAIGVSAIGSATNEEITAWMTADEPVLVILDQVEEAITHRVVAKAEGGEATGTEAPDHTSLASSGGRRKTTADPSLTTPRLKKTPGAPCDRDDTSIQILKEVGVGLSFGDVTRTASGDPLDELNEFVERLVRIFVDPVTKKLRYPETKARLLLSFRKEYLAEIRGLFTKYGGDSPELMEMFWLDRLDREGIVQVVEGPTLKADLAKKYRITLEDNFAEYVASKLNDPNSSIATVLQILLNKLWEKAQEQGGDPVYTRELFDSLSALDNPLQGFYGERLDKVYETDGAAKFRQGVELDLLLEHTTELGTSRRRTLKELQECYPEVPDIARLVQANKDQYLLTQPATNAGGPDIATEVAATESVTALTHDTLAPVIRRDYTLSLTPGARARRLLENRAREWVDGKSGNPLDGSDLRVVKKGLAHMRALTKDEKRLLEESRKRQRRIQAYAAAILIGIAAIGGSVAWHYKKVADAQTLEAQRQARTKRSVRLAQSAKSAEGNRYDLAVLLSIAAWEESPTNEARNAIWNVFLSKPDVEGLLPWSGTRLKEPGGGTALSADGKWLATSYGRTVEFWNVADKTRMWSVTLPGNEDEDVAGIALSPDGSLVAFSVGDALKWKPLEVWKTADHSPLSPLKSKTANLFGTASQAFSADGKYLAASNCRTTQVWTLPDLHELREHAEGYSMCANDTSGRDMAGLAFNPVNSGQMAVIYSAGKVEIQDTRTGKLLKTVQAASPKDTSPYYQSVVLPALAFSGDGNWLAASTGASGIDVHNLKTGRHVGTIAPEKHIMTLGLNQDGSRLVGVSDQGEFAVWDTTSLAIVKPYTQQAGRWADGLLADKLLMGHTVLGNAIAPGLNPVAVQMNSGDVILLDATRSWGGVPTQHAGAAKDVRTAGIAFSPDGKWIATAGRDGTVRLWDAAGRKQAWSFQNSGEADSIAFSNDGRLLTFPLRGSEDAPRIDERLLDVANWKVGDWKTRDLKDAHLHTRRNTSEELHDIVDKESTLVNVATGPGGELVARSNLGFIRAGNGAGWALVAGFPDMAADTDDVGTGMALSPDGTELAVAGPEENRFSLWKITGQQATSVFHAENGHRANVLTFDPAGGANELLAEGDADGFSLWNPATGRRVAGVTDGSLAEVLNLSFSPDGSLLAILEAGGRIQLWDVSLGNMLEEDLQPRLPLKRDSLGLTVDDFARGVAFSPDGKRIVAGTRHGGFRSWDWDVDPATWTELGCNVVHRNLTHEEWDKYVGDEPYRKVCQKLPD